MKGLLLKDLLQAWSYCKRLLVFAAIFMAISGLSLDHYTGVNAFLMCGGLLFGSVPMTLLSFDETAGWAAYTRALPVTKAQLVSAKYLLGLLGAGISLLMGGVALAIQWVRMGSLAPGLVAVALLTPSLCALMSMIFLLPLVYRYGVEKARMCYFILAGLIGGVTVAFQTAWAEGAFQALVTWLPRSGLGLGLLLAACTVLLLALSWGLSIAWYDHRKQ